MRARDFEQGCLLLAATAGGRCQKSGGAQSFRKLRRSIHVGYMMQCRLISDPRAGGPLLQRVKLTGCQALGEEKRGAPR